MDATNPPAIGGAAKAVIAIQTVVFTFMLLFVLILIGDLGKRNVPGAPVSYLYVCLAATVIVTFSHWPHVFQRLPRMAKFTAYLAVPAVLVMNVNYGSAMHAAYVRTPDGAKEAAEQAEAERRAGVKRAEADRQAAAAEAQEAIRQRAEQDSAVQAKAAEEQASLEEQKSELCHTLVDQVVDGEKVLEINNVSVQKSYTPNEVLTCSGDAITAHGDVKIEFGLVQTPQGKALISTRFP